VKKGERIQGANFRNFEGKGYDFQKRNRDPDLEGSETGEKAEPLFPKKNRDGCGVSGQKEEIAQDGETKAQFGNKDTMLGVGAERKK